MKEGKHKTPKKEKEKKEKKKRKKGKKSKEPEEAELDGVINETGERRTRVKIRSENWKKWCHFFLHQIGMGTKRV